MASRARVTQEPTSPPELVSAQITPSRGHGSSIESSRVSYNRAVSSQAQGAQRPLSTANEPEFAGSRTTTAKNGLIVGLLCVAVFLIAAATTFLEAYFRDHRSVATAIPARRVRVLRARSGIVEMRAEPQGDRLLLTWDRNSPALQSVTAGVLHIDDGAQHEEIALDRDTISSGSISYRPASGNVAFRLELRGDEGASVAGSLKITDTTAHAAGVEAQPERDTPGTEKTSSAEGVASQRGSKEVNTPREISTGPASSPAVSRSSPKVILSEAPAPRSSERSIKGGQNLPSLPMDSINGSQPSLLAQQTLPKPPPAPSTSAVQSTKNTTLRPHTPINPQLPPREPVSREVIPSRAAAQPAVQPRSIQNLGYIPARPLKWATPDAKSLGVSRMPQSIDIAIKIRIDDSGHVTSAHALLDGSIHDKAVLAAATAVVKQWTFEPAKMQGKNVASEDTIVIHVDPKR